MDNLADFYGQMLADLPSQFKNKEKIEGLIYALSRQLNCVRDFFMQLNDARSLRTAEGKQLDGIGEIAVLSRDEATKLALKSASFTQMTDEIYRLYLIQKIMANMANCTYPELYQAMVILWGKTPIWYSEDINEPATITMTVPALSSFDETASFLGVWELRPAGVQLNFTATASESIRINADFKGSAFVITHIKTGTNPQRAVILTFDGIVVDELLSKQTFTPNHENTRESLHSGTNPMRILTLDIDGIQITGAIKNEAFTQTHDKAGTKPRDAVLMRFQGIEVKEQGKTSKFIVEPPQTSENLHSGTYPSTIMLLDSEVAGIVETLSKEVYGIEHERSGTEPQRAVTGGSDSAGIAAGLTPTSFSVKYKKCGRGVTKS